MEGGGLQVYQAEFITDTTMHELVASQSDIGWNHLLLGRVSKLWRDIGPGVGYQKDPIEWSKSLVRLMLQFGLNM